LRENYFDFHGLTGATPEKCFSFRVITVKPLLRAMAAVKESAQGGR
jgi:hypothetical protein